MGYYEIAFELSEKGWGYYTRKFPEITMYVHHYIWIDNDRYVGVFRIFGKDREAFLEEVRNDPKNVEKIHIVEKAGNSITVWITARLVPPLHFFRDAGVVVLTPIVLKNGILRGVVCMPSKHFKAFMENIKDKYKIWVEGKSPDPAKIPLTPKEMEVLDGAVKNGYYSVPRKITQKELAKRLGLSPSYLSEVLNRIESKIISRSKFNGLKDIM